MYSRNTIQGRTDPSWSKTIKKSHPFRWLNWENSSQKKTGFSFFNQKAVKKLCIFSPWYKCRSKHFDFSQVNASHRKLLGDELTHKVGRTKRTAKPQIQGPSCHARNALPLGFQATNHTYNLFVLFILVFKIIIT